MERTCPRCQGPMTMQVQAVIQAPSALEHLLSKQNLHRKDVFLRGVLWETADHICNNPACGYVINGYGNYVTKLKKRNEFLEELVKKYEQD